MNDFESGVSVENVFKQCKQQANLIEIRFEERIGSEIVVVNKNVETIKDIAISGGNVSAFVSGGRGFVCFNDPKQIAKYCEQAIKQALLMDAELKKLSTRKPQTSLNVSPIEDVIKNDTDENPLDISQREKIALMKEYTNLILSFQGVRSATVDYTDMMVHKHYFNSNGSNIEQEITRASITALAVAKKGDIVEQAWAVNTSVGGFKIMRKLYDNMSETARRVVNLLDAKTAKTKNCPVVLHPAFAGMFVHEAFGHLSEADNLLRSKTLQRKMKIGTVVGNKVLNIVDQPTLRKSGCCSYDDEGIQHFRTVLVKEGKIDGRLHSCRTAMQMGENPTGNARAVDFGFPPIVRMSSTYIDEGDWTFEEMIENVREGVYLRLPRAGMTDMKGQFVLGSQESFQIEKGNIGSILRNVSIVGNVFNALKNLEAIGNDLKLVDASCTKDGQAGLPVSYGGPHIKIKNMLVTGA